MINDTNFNEREIKEILDTVNTMTDRQKIAMYTYIGVSIENPLVDIHGTWEIIEAMTDKQKNVVYALAEAAVRRRWL